MRPALLVVFCAALWGCDVLGLGGVEAVVIERVVVETLPLDRPWDNPITRDRPDVYVDVFDLDQAFFPMPNYRSPVVENVDSSALPLVFVLDTPLRLDLDTQVRLNVADRDGVADDEMFTTGTFTFGDRYRGAAGGETETLVFMDSTSVVRLTVRWE